MTATTTTVAETPAQITAHPDWCDRQNCYTDEGAAVTTRPA